MEDVKVVEIYKDGDELKIRGNNVDGNFALNAMALFAGIAALELFREGFDAEDAHKKVISALENGVTNAFENLRKSEYREQIVHEAYINNKLRSIMDLD